MGRRLHSGMPASQRPVVVIRTAGLPYSGAPSRPLEVQIIVRSIGWICDARFSQPRRDIVPTSLDLRGLVTTILLIRLPTDMRSCLKP